jgi:hypothetical protein
MRLGIMANDQIGEKIALGTPATYRIRVRGFLVHGWNERLGNMRIVTVSSKEEPPITTLEGRVKDQSEVIGLMNSLYDLHLPILSVELLSVG